MVKQDIPLEEALKQFNRAALRDEVRLAEQERQELVKRFPQESWPSLPLEQYALGQGNSRQTYCWLLEFGTPHVGSMRGGAAKKHLIFKRKDGDWYFDSRSYKDQNQAWEATRGGIVEALKKARLGDWDGIDEIEVLYGGAALRTKTLHVYYPNELLPICSVVHIRHFLAQLNDPSSEDKSYDVVRLNRILLQRVRRIEQMREWSTKEIERFLYSWQSPFDSRRMVKIAPGPNARFWDDCLRNGFICAGWHEIPDLRQYDSKEAYLADYTKLCGDAHKGHKAAITKMGNELWTLRELEPGDLVFANRGTSYILGVGEVVEPGYEYLEDRPEYKHVVHVKWDTSKARDIPPQKHWLSTVQPVPQTVANLVLKGGPGPAALDRVWTELGESLERKGQAILYGPPGTGKTYTARRFATWWLLKQMGEDASAAMGDEEKLRQAEQRLSTAKPQGVAHFTLLTFHASYSYEDFIEGFRPVDSGNGSVALRLESGVFKRVCRAARDNPSKPYLVLVDEINRANVAKVFGELITLLEKDKRGLPITLPQSKESFTIPANVYLLGTMNTADKSIKLLDAALRRRFAFVELMPDSDLLKGKVGNLPIDDFLDELNRRIAEREGREKQIGHSFLLDGTGPVTEPAEFARRFRQEILPLLQEYCYDDYAVLAKYIGEKLVDKDGQTLDDDILLDPDRLIDALEEEFGEPGPQP